jgi:uncharacterized membrane protein YagU involved in acid resistance
LIVGGLDLLTAFADYYIATGKGPENVLKYIASGVFGTSAFTGGNTMLLWGVLFHYIIAFIFTLFFFYLFRRIKFMQSNTILTGILYGIFIWLIMNMIIVPISHAPTGSFDLLKSIKAALILIIMIGLPLSIIAKRYYAKAT